jgi:hypothetical protein
MWKGVKMEADNTAKYGNNGMAITSLIFNILAWVLALIMLCINFVIVPLATAATFGGGLIFYVCTLPVSCLSPLGWLVGAITGYVAKNQIKETGVGGMGMANAGLIMSAIGLGITLLLICLAVVLPLVGVSIPFLSDPALFDY